LLNHVPRKILGYKTPHEVFSRLKLGAPKPLRFKFEAAQPYGQISRYGFEFERTIFFPNHFQTEYKLSLSDRYDSFYANVPPNEVLTDIPRYSWPVNRVESVVAFAGRGQSVLDVGCGNGHLLYQLRNQYAELHGLEYSPHRLEQARKNLSSLPFRGVVGSAEEMLEYPSDAFDCVVSADTIEHVPDVYRAAAELFRVLKPGGRLVINTPNIAFIKKRCLLLGGLFPSTSQKNEGLGSDVLFDGGHLHYFTFRSLGLVLDRAGFELISRVGFGRFGRVHNFWPTMLSGGVQWIAKKPLIRTDVRGGQLA
jgi:SAM-dependent methyltransferase